MQTDEGETTAPREKTRGGEKRGEELISMRNSPLGGAVHVSLKTQKTAGSVIGDHKESPEQSPINVLVE